VSSSTTTAGRTTWSARDAAHHDRELVVELLEEFGPAGPYVDVVLRDLAQQQRDGGTIKTGFRSLGRKTKLDPEHVRRIVEHGAAIGIFDDLEIDTDGRRFTCRVSGWDADQDRGKSAWKKAAQRAKETEGQGGDMSTSEVDMSPSGSPTRPNQTNTEGANAPSSSLERRPEIDHLCGLLAQLIRANDPKAPVAPDGKAWQDACRLLLDRDGRSAAEIEAVIRWSQAHDFWRANVLGMPKLRRQFTQLLLQMNRAGSSAGPPAAGSRAAQRSAALRGLTGRAA
jgi:hypothetical protein